jgi:hypothetical protein
MHKECAMITSTICRLARRLHDSPRTPVEQGRGIPPRLGAAIAAVIACVLPITACSFDKLVSTEVPPTFRDPEAFKNLPGAISLYRGGIDQFRSATTGAGTAATTGSTTGLGPPFVVLSGLLSDELTSGVIGGDPSTVSQVDSRTLPEIPSGQATALYGNVWQRLHATRTQAMVAIGALHTYGTSAQNDYIGHLFAVWGMSENMLASAYCSGIPLTTLKYEGGIEYAPGSTSVEVYEHAITMFDSALVYAQDSAAFRNLARVGRGWALLNLGRYGEAALAVHGVPDDFVYNNPHAASINPNFTNPGFFTTSSIGTIGTQADREGQNGLPYRSSADPRTAATSFPTAELGTIFLPTRWVTPARGTGPIVMASGVEARLIEAEAALAANDPAWLTILNTLRTDGSFTTKPRATPSTVVDTTWGPGTGRALFSALPGFPGLRPLADPGSQQARVDLLFQERAFWLFLTGRRVGDMRRLIRQYGRTADTVFPVGPYSGAGGRYGDDVTVPPPPEEQRINPKYQGCFNRDA